MKAKCLKFAITNQALIKSLAALCAFSGVDLERIVEVLIDLTEEDEEYFEYSIDAIGTIDDDKLNELAANVIRHSVHERIQIQDKVGVKNTLYAATVMGRRLYIDIIHRPGKEKIQCS